MKNLSTVALILISILKLSAQHDLGTGNLSSCSETIYDDGGPAGIYAINTTTIEQYCSDNGDCITISFSSFELENTWDFLKIYDGPNVSSPQIGPAAGYTGTNSPGVVNSSTGCLTFELISDISNALSGYEATISCAACPTCNPPSALGTNSISGFDAELIWTENGTATEWDIELGTTGFVPIGTPTAENITNPINYGGLNTTTTYDYYVRADCGGPTSSWVGPFTFTTTTLPPGTSCGDPLILTLPHTKTNASTVGFGDTYSTGCDLNYIGGNDYVMSYTPATDECVSITFTNLSGDGSFFLMDDCPDAGGTCLGMQRGGFITGNLDYPQLTGGTTYYFIVSSDYRVDQTINYNLYIRSVACPTCDDGIRNGDETNIDCGGSCPSICQGTTCANAFEITSIPFRTENNTTDNMGNSISTYACGAGSGWNGEDFIYKYTATAADTCVTIAIEDLRTINIELFLYDGCPGVGSCVSSATNATGAPNASTYIENVSLVDGQEYYIVVDGTSGDNDFDFSIGNYCTAPDCGPSNIPASDFCSSATQLDNLQGFCGTTSSTYTTSPADDPDGTEFCASIENNSWYKFTADSTAAAINVYVYDCIGASIEGIQIVIYETFDCNTYNAVSNCWNPKIMTNGIVSASNLVIGQDYYIMVDGNGGEVCNYTIQVVDGIDVQLGLNKISNMKVNCNSKNNIIEWKSTKSSDKIDFHVEKSLNGKDFKSMVKMNKLENESSFSYTDNNSSNQKTYYRIKQVSTQGDVSYSKTISTQCEKSDFNINLYPNPAYNVLNINSNKEQISSIQIHNLQGKLVQNEIDINNESFHLNISNLNEGVYFIKINSVNGMQESTKFIKTK